MMTLVAKENIIMCLQQPQVRAMLETARKEGNEEYGFADLAGKLEDGEFQLWLLHEESKLKLVMVTQIEVWPRLRRMRVELVAGSEFDDYLKHLDQLKIWAKHYKCKDIVSQVRPGLVRKLEPLGFKTMGVNVLLSLENENAGTP